MSRCPQTLEEDDFEIDPHLAQHFALRPPVKQSHVRTWMAELAFVATVLLAIAIVRASWVEVVGAIAVTLSFAHAQVGERMAEREAVRLVNTTHRSRVDVDEFVHCAHWSGRYFVAKEVLWCIYFVAHGSWSALAGVGLFLAYPLWRRWWRRSHPMRFR